MRTVVNFSKLPAYPEVRVTKIMTEVVENQGLITPILLIDRDNNSVYKGDLERYEAFRRAAQEYGTVDTCLVVWLDELDAEERREYE